MKRTFSGKGASAALLALLLAGISIGCPGGAQNEEAPVLQSIEVTRAPEKTVYAKGEDLDLTGLVVTGTYSDGTTKQEAVDRSNITGYNANSEGRQTVIVTINGKTATFFVTVMASGGAAVLQSIAVTRAPAKTAYAKGEELDLDGLVVTGTYSDGTTKQESVDLSNITGYNANSIGQQTLTVTIDGKTATFSVTVRDGTAVLQSIEVTRAPEKTVYAKGEDLDLTGLVVAGTYSDGSTKQETVDQSNITGYNANSIGQQTLTVTIDGKTAYFAVSVQASVSVAVSLDPDPIHGLPDDIILSKTGTPASIDLEIAGAYASYTWRLNDNETPVSTTAGYTLNAASCPLGANFLTVEVRTSGGAYYSIEITFTVIT